MKRPCYASISFLSLIVIASLLLQHRLATAASLRSIRSPVVVNESVENEDNSDTDVTVLSSSPLHPASPGEITPSSHIKKSLTVGLSKSYHNNSDDYGARTSARKIPLIGVGVGNLPHNKIPFILASAFDTKNKRTSPPTLEIMTDDLNYKLVDTSHTADSALEVLVGRSLSRLSAPIGGCNENNFYHVMIKIWHTHLGYERTMLSVQNSLSDILPAVSFSTETTQGSNHRNNDANTGKRSSGRGKSNVRIHAILQYPRCYDELFTSPAYLNSPNIPTKYHNCKEEEDALDSTIKTISNGQSPLLDKENAWRRSYHALEELYHYGTIESIGVSNFGPSDMVQLLDIASVGPHIYQGSLRTLMMQEDLLETLVQHGVHYQCYDAVSSILTGREDAPLAYSKLEHIGAKHGGLMDVNSVNTVDKSTTSDGVYGYSPIQVVLGYLVHHRGVGVIPGTADVAHLAENSPSSLEKMPRFSPREVYDIEKAILSLLNKEDAVGDNIYLGSDSQAAVSEENLSPNNGFTHGMSGIQEMSLDDEGGGVVATFFNTLPHPRSVRIFQVHPETGEQIQLSNGIPSGRNGRLIVNIDDVLIAYDAYGTAVQKFLVEEDNGNEMNGHVDFIVKSS